MCVHLDTLVPCGLLMRIYYFSILTSTDTKKKFAKWEILHYFVTFNPKCLSVWVYLYKLWGTDLYRDQYICLILYLDPQALSVSKVCIWED